MITSAKYEKSKIANPDNENTSITAVIGGETWSVPISSNNRHYQAIQEWVAEGNKIEDAD
jgi:hypothetical protein